MPEGHVSTQSKDQASGTASATPTDTESWRETVRRRVRAFERRREDARLTPGRPAEQLVLALASDPGPPLEAVLAPPQEPARHEPTPAVLEETLGDDEAAAIARSILLRHQPTPHLVEMAAQPEPLAEWEPPEVRTEVVAATAATIADSAAALPATNAPKAAVLPGAELPPWEPETGPAEPAATAPYLARAPLGLRAVACVVDVSLVGLTWCVNLALTARLLAATPAALCLTNPLPYVGFALVLALGYFTLLVASAGQTLGLALVGLEVRRVGGGRPQPLEALARAATLVVSSLALGANGLHALGAADGRSLADRIAGTEIVGRELS